MGSAFRQGPGGKGSNQAIAAARLGGVVNFISKVGTDSFGELARSVHRNAGVDLDYLFTTPDFATGAAAIIVDEASGENAIVVAPGAANALTLSDIDSARARRSGTSLSTSRRCDHRQGSSLAHSRSAHRKFERPPLGRRTWKRFGSDRQSCGPFLCGALGSGRC